MLMQLLSFLPSSCPLKKLFISQDCLSLSLISSSLCWQMLFMSLSFSLSLSSYQFLISAICFSWSRRMRQMSSLSLSVSHFRLLISSSSRFFQSLCLLLRVLSQSWWRWACVFISFWVCCSRKDQFCLQLIMMDSLTCLCLDSFSWYSAISACSSSIFCTRMLLSLRCSSSFAASCFYNLPISIFITDNNKTTQLKVDPLHPNINYQYNSTETIQPKMEVFSTKHPNKQNRSQSPSKELQKMRIELSDKIFEINKLEEDFAQEKARHFIDFQKERQGLNRVIKELKEKSLVDNEEWGKKIQEFRQKAEEDARMVKRECEERIAEASVAIKKEVQAAFQEQVKCLNSKIKENQSSYSLTLAKLQVDHQKLIYSLSQTHKHQLQAKENQHKSAIQAIKKQHQAKVQTLQKLYICEESTKTAIQKQYQDYMQQKVREKLQLENQVESLRQKVKTLEQEVKTHQREAQSSKERQAITKTMYEEKIKDSNVQKMKEIQMVVDEFNQKSIAQRQQYECQLRRANQQVKNMSSIYKQKQNKWRERGQLLLKTVQNSVKPNDGDTTIKKLEYQLMRKQALLQKEKQTLKNCRLQLQNMQQIYDKMFVSNNYLYKFRSKTFKVKKARVLSNQLNQSNNSISMVERFNTQA